MKQAIGTFLMIVGLLGVAGLSRVSAQSQAYPWAFRVGLSFFQYQAAPRTPKLSQQFYDPGLYVAASRHLGDAFNFTADISYVPSINFPLGVERVSRAYLIDMSYQLSFKLDNGVILPANGWIGPYVSMGVGGSYVPDNPDAYFPLGGGTRIRINQRSNVYLQAIKKFSLNKGYQNTAFTVAFSYGLAKKGDKEVLPEEESILLDSLVVNADSIPMVDSSEVALVEEMPKEEIEPEATTQTEAFQQPDEATLEKQAPILPQPEEKTESIASSVQPKPSEAPVSSQPEEEFDPLDQLPCEGDKHMLKQVFQSVYFEYGSDEISEESKRKLDKIAAMMYRCPALRIKVLGHTDTSGSSNQNQVLSVKRAFKVKYYLVYHHGISQAKILSKGLGESEPAVATDKEDEQWQNRRVVFKLLF